MTTCRLIPIFSIITSYIIHAFFFSLCLGKIRGLRRIGERPGGVQTKKCGPRRGKARGSRKRTESRK